MTGVLADYTRSHFLFESLVSFSTLEVLQQEGKINQLNDWGPKTNFYTYLLLTPGKSPEDVAQATKKISDDHFASNPTYFVEVSLQPLSSIPWTDHYNEIGLVWGFASMVIFFVLAILVLLPACFNYSNISIARAIRRAKEIGLRKVSGGQSRNIFLQMIMETIIISLISLGGAILLFQVIRSEFLEMIVSGSKTFDFQITPITFFIFFLFAIGTGILAGIFPAAYFSKLNPIETLRNSTSSGRLSKISIRKGLIVFQFVITLVFILAVSILARQYVFMLNYNMGFQKENILEIPLKGVKPELFKTELERLPDVRSVAMSSAIPGSWGGTVMWVKQDASHDSVRVHQIFIDEDFIECLEIERISGAGFSAQQAHDEEFIIVNETFLKELSIVPQEALGTQFTIDENRTVRVLGVVKDFNFQPLREKIDPFFFRYNPNYFAYANVKIASDDITSTLLRMDAIWKNLSPDQSFEAKFLDAHVEEMSLSIRSMIKIFGFLGLLAITISCLGLLAVVISTSESRIKEMGIRKIMGANVLNLAYNLSRGFLKLIGIAILIATPLAYFFFDKLFLRIEYYRASIGALEILSGVLVLVILVVVTVGGQTFRIARINPVDTLKYE
ncbi:MAG: FtsX-like permease family protein [Flammeovirgaceae bacterium]|nr:FtsX-like permease family protein [Flammeovirgaceae bacterium]